MKTTIDPCPFCGGEAVYSSNVLEHYGLDMPGVECSECQVRNFANSEDEAISAWNKRTEVAPAAIPTT